MPRRNPPLPVPKDGLLLPAVQESLQALKTDAKQDAGLRRLAEVYAAAIDEGLDVALEARELARRAEDEDDPLEIGKRVLNALMKYTDATTTLEQLGSKLQSALEALGGSPKARDTMARGKRPGGGDKPNDAKPELTPFEKRRAAAAERENAARANRPAIVDPSA